MSKTILQQLYDGEIFPAEEINPKQPEYRKLLQKHAMEKDYLRERLPESDRERFDEMENISQEIGDLYSYEDFSCGFRLGLLIALEVTQEPETLSNE